MMNRMHLVLLLMIVGVSSSMAQSRVSITANALHASKKIAQITGELKIIDNISISGVAGYGFRDGENVTVGGGQVRVYLSGGFDNGMHIGAEALYAELGKSKSIDGMVNLMNGASAGPFVGYKYSFDFGLTFDIMGGIRYSEGRIETGAPGSPEAKLGPLASINVGWSF